MFIETAIASSLEHRLKKELNPNEKLLKQASVGFPEVRMNEADVSITVNPFAPQNAMMPVLGYSPYNAALAFERRPEKMAFDVCSRLIEGGFNYQNWVLCDIEGKKEMLKNALEIMSQEMLIPYQFSNINLEFKKLEKANGEMVPFLRFKPGTNQYEIIGSPTIRINTDVISDENFTQNMGTLFHEMLHIMQYAASIEPIPYTDDVAYWRDNIARRELYNGEGYTPYITSPIEAYAHAQTELFEKTLLGMLDDINKGYRRI